MGYERIQDMSDPSLSVDRAREFWKSAGRSEKWIQQRMMGQETRNKLIRLLSQPIEKTISALARHFFKLKTSP